MPPKFLYFDLGNVLLTFSNERMIRQMADVAGVDEAVVRAAILPTGTESDLQWRFEAGAVSEDEYHAAFNKATGTSAVVDDLAIAASDMFEPIDASFDLALRLASAGHRLGILSNTNLWHWRFVLDGRYPALQEAFAVQVTSFDAKSMKPDPRIYEVAIERAGVEPHEIFFTDDRPENVAGACAMGIDAVRFISTGQLIEDLRRRGIEAPASGGSP